MQIQPDSTTYTTSHVSLPFLSTFSPIMHHLLAPQLSVQQAPPRKRKGGMANPTLPVVPRIRVCRGRLVDHVDSDW